MPNWRKYVLRTLHLDYCNSDSDSYKSREDLIAIANNYAEREEINGHIDDLIDEGYILSDGNGKVTLNSKRNTELYAILGGN